MSVFGGNVAGWRAGPDGRAAPIARDCSLCAEKESARYFLSGLWLCPPCYQHEFYRRVAP